MIWLAFTAGIFGTGYMVGHRMCSWSMQSRREETAKPRLFMVGYLEPKARTEVDDLLMRIRRN